MDPTMAAPQREYERIRFYLPRRLVAALRRRVKDDDAAHCLSCVVTHALKDHLHPDK